MKDIKYQAFNRFINRESHSFGQNIYEEAADTAGRTSYFYYNIDSIKSNKLSSEFLLAYILPLIAFDFSNLKSLALFVVYFAILAFLCIRNNNIYTNIFLEFKRYRIYLCDIERLVPGDKTTIYYDSLIISKEDLTLLEDKSIKYWDCDNYIYIHIKENIDNE